MIRKIIITGDILRPREGNFSSSHQNENIKVLYNMLQFYLAKVTGLPVEILLWDENNGFDSRFFYNLMKLNISTDNWALLYDGELLCNTPVCLEYLDDFVRDSLVIGFELSDALTSMLNKLLINYIDTAIHPVRYLDDIFLAFRTNNPDIFNKIKQHSLSEDLFHVQAGFHKATISEMIELNHDYKAALVVGQTLADRSLVNSGKVLTLLDYKDKFEELGSKYSFVYYKRHPFAMNDSKILDYLKTLPFVKNINQNIYYLLCQESISKVCGISSSVIYEAQFFGKEIEYFSQNPYKFINLENYEFDRLSYIPVFNDYLNPQFWTDVLLPVVETSKYSLRNVDLSQKPNRLRIMFNGFWGYPFLESEIVIKNSLKNR